MRDKHSFGCVDPELGYRANGCGVLIHKPSINPLYLKNLVSLKVQAPTIIFYCLDSLCTQYRNYLHAIAIYGQRTVY